MRTKLTILTLIMLVAVMLSACAAGTAAPAATTTQTRVMTVDGQVQVSAKPDVAYISIGVHTEDPNAATAVANNSAQAQRVMDALAAKGIDAKDLQTTSFSIYPQDEYAPDGTKTGTRFVVDNTVYVTLRDIAKVGDVLGAAVEAGANSISGIQFDLADKTSLLSGARDQAIAEARKQAEEMAKAAGVTLGSIQSINFYNNIPVPMYDNKVVRAEGVGGGAPPISAGQLTFTVNVTLTFEIK